MNNSLNIPIKLVALDMDGTTLRSDGTLSPRNREAIIMAMERGVAVAIATGRPLEVLPGNVLREVDIRYAITSNGANVADLKEKRSLYVNTMKGRALTDVCSLLRKYDLLIEGFVDGRPYMDKGWVKRAQGYGLPEYYLKYALKTRHPVEDLLGFLERAETGVENINIDFGDLSLKPEIYEGLSEISGIAITSSFPHNWEVGAETVSKADGMKALCRHLGIPYSQTMAVGDQENDLAMVAFAGVSVAVENAADCVKAAACFIAPSNDQDGVGAAIERFVLNGWPEGSGRAAEVNEE